MPKVNTAIGSAIRMTSGQTTAASTPSTSAATGGCHQSLMANPDSQASSTTSTPVTVAQTSSSRASVRPPRSTLPGRVGPLTASGRGPAPGRRLRGPCGAAAGGWRPG